MRVVIAGDRNVTDYELVKKAIEESGFEITEVVSGMAKGVDSLAVQWAKEKGIPWKEFPAEWDNMELPGAVVKTRWDKWKKRNVKYNATAGHYRNGQMADYGEAAIVIQPNGPTDGSQDMLKRMKEKKKPYFEYKRQESDYEYLF
jgi:hypothetical protein